jgi:hypothetical protein
MFPHDDPCPVTRWTIRDQSEDQSCHMSSCPLQKNHKTLTPLVTTGVRTITRTGISDHDSTTHLTTSCVLPLLLQTKFVERAKKKTVMEGGVKSEIINVTLGYGGQRGEN